MMPISDFYRLVGNAVRRTEGYTLIEIIMVVTLIGLMAGIAVPRMVTLYESSRWASERDDVLRVIAGLGYTAFREARSFELTHYPGPPDAEGLPLELPEGWRIDAEEPIRYSAEGVCFGGMLHLSKGKRTMPVQLTPPLCVPRSP